MQKAEKQQVRNPYSPREPGGLSMDSPNGERVAQFQSMIDSSPVMASQRRKMERIEQRQEEGPLQTKPNETGLPDNLKSGIKSLSGMSMDSVRVHYNSSKPAQLNALAYAQGTDIHVAPGQEQHLPHEA
ncbi:MAG: DUF4157 domain-containing protein [Burkholderiales bacterium]|nr:DUF4157 domain-containing protein [Burkholderiales bacterium]